MENINNTLRDNKGRFIKGIKYPKDIKKVCIICGKEFLTSSNKSKYCSKECSYQYGTKKIPNTNCSFCNKPIYRKQSKLNKYDKPYCSMECLKNDYKTRFIGNNNPNFNNKWTQEQKDNLSIKKTKYPVNEKEVKELYYKGWTDKEIADRFGCDDSKIGAIRHNLGLISTFKSGNLTIQQKDNLKRYGVKDIRYQDCIRFGTGKLKHESAKFAISWILMRNGSHIITEAETIGGIIDVFDLTNRVIYEVETKYSEKKKEDKMKQLFMEDTMEDFFIFDLREVPDNIMDMIPYFCNKMGVDVNKCLI